MPSHHRGHGKWQTPWFKRRFCSHCYLAVTNSDGRPSSVLKVSNQFGYSSYFRHEWRKPRVLNGKYFLVFGSPEWFGENCVKLHGLLPLVTFARFRVLFWISVSTFFASHLFVKGILCCVIRRTCKRSRAVWPFDHLAYKAGLHIFRFYLDLSATSQTLVRTRGQVASATQIIVSVDSQKYLHYFVLNIFTLTGNV